MLNWAIRIKFIVLSLAFAMTTASAQTNIALVIGNSTYQVAKPLSTTIADASAVAETMRGAGYDVTFIQDVRQSDLGQVLRNFLDKVASANGNAVAFFYYAGYGAQVGGSNFLIPVDAAISGADDVAAQSLRLGDFVDLLRKTPAAARIIILDASYDHGFGRGTTQAVPLGLAAMSAPAGMAIASAAAPRQVVVQGGGTRSFYTHALVTMMRQRGLELDQIFKAVRYQVFQATNGRQTPWVSTALMVDVTLFPTSASAASPKVDTPAPPAAESRKKSEARRRVERPRRERTTRVPAAPAQSSQTPGLPAVIGITPGGVSIGIGQ